MKAFKWGFGLGLVAGFVVGGDLMVRLWRRVFYPKQFGPPPWPFTGWKSDEDPREIS